jgi:hypothetical protein
MPGSNTQLPRDNAGEAGNTIVGLDNSSSIVRREKYCPSPRSLNQAQPPAINEFVKSVIVPNLQG